jgi:hypothetical protein
MNYLRTLLDGSEGTGADKQIALYEQTNDPVAVQKFLMDQTMQGVTLDSVDLSDRFLRFKMYETVGEK